MELYQAFMVAERQNRIFRNNQKINLLESEINKMNEKYKDIVLQINELKTEYLEIEKQLSILEKDYITYKDEKYLYDISECIQTLSESMELKEEQIQFVKCLKEAYNNKKLPMFKGLSYFYKYKNNVEIEENCKNANFIKVVYSYFKQYRNLKKIGLQFNEKNITNIVLKYELEKQNMIIQSNGLFEQIEKRRKYLKIYPENKEIMKQKLIEITKKIKKLNLLFDCESYKQKRDMKIKLEKENEIYYAQIDGLIKLDNTQNTQEILQHEKIIPFRKSA